MRQALIRTLGLGACAENVDALCRIAKEDAEMTVSLRVELSGDLDVGTANRVVAGEIIAAVQGVLEARGMLFSQYMSERKSEVWYRPFNAISPAPFPIGDSGTGTVVEFSTSYHAPEPKE